jgi:indolepyruvate ferredoxin oxidoreductase beta subunit
MESLRYLPMLSPEGWVITNTTPFINITNYPSEEVLMKEINKLPHKVAVDADKIAKELGSARSANMVVLGAASPFINMEFQALEQAIRDVFGRKGENIVEVNLACLRAGRQYAESERVNK